MAISQLFVSESVKEKEKQQRTHYGAADKF